MRIRRTLEKRMRDVEALGRGVFYEEAEEGEILFSTEIEGGRLNVYVDGFVFGSDEVTNKLLFADISSIESHLGVELFSNASRSGCVDFYVPLDVKCGFSNFALFLPFLTYSNVMNILIGLREDWMKQISPKV
ncbi:hypothetical protein E3Z27_12440 [Pseudomonas mediterranea]|uniref:hypothetical protein n=1 Tax=Pseudomonas mediterranea TaxID=183795 RepID=UPI0013175D73|nr:hypothetical protein [Pseudomonas mediterranea]QHA82429.1 hypothetical protein E3Z27_12440 [Pseudomonas mediterranea]